MPAEMKISPLEVALQNRLPPQREQKPRSTLCDDRYQRNVDEVSSLRSADRQAAMAAKLPLVRAHWVQ